jgi:hypothetical protein
MYNHYHVVLFIDKDCAEHWSELKVAEHWHQVFSGNTYSQRFLNGESLSVAEQANLSRSTGLWRARLMDISWFMRILNDKIIWNVLNSFTGPEGVSIRTIRIAYRAPGQLGRSVYRPILGGSLLKPGIARRKSISCLFRLHRSQSH